MCECVCEEACPRVSTLTHVLVPQDVTRDVATLLHRVALTLMTRLHVGDAHVAHDVLSHVVFNARFVG